MRGRGGDFMKSMQASYLSLAWQNSVTWQPFVMFHPWLVHYSLAAKVKNLYITY